MARIGEPGEQQEEIVVVPVEQPVFAPAEPTPVREPEQEPVPAAPVKE